MLDKKELSGNIELTLRRVTLERTLGQSEPGTRICYHFLEGLEASSRALFIFLL